MAAQGHTVFIHDDGVVDVTRPPSPDMPIEAAEVVCAAGTAASAAVGISVAAAILGTSATSIAAMGGAAAKGSGASSGSVLSAALPVVMGAQRYSSSSGLSTDMSSTYRSAVSGMDWASGDVSKDGACMIPRGHNHTGGDEETDPPNPSKESCDALNTLLTAFASTMGGAVSLHVFVHFSWKYNVNRANSRNNPWFASTAPFLPYPQTFVFPGLMLLLTSVFLTGMVGNAGMMIAHAYVTNGVRTCDGRGCTCRALAATALAIELVYLVLTIRLLLRFGGVMRFNPGLWQPSEAVTDESNIKDPLFRTVYKIRKRVVSMLRKYDFHGDRMRGKFVRPKWDTMEPKRTQRLLDHPVTLMRDNPSDALDGYGFSLMLRASGSSASGTAFELVVLGAQVLVSLLNGIGTGLGLAPRTIGAIIHVSAVWLVQSITSVWILGWSPSNDRMVSLVVGLQFALEAGQTTLLSVYTYTHIPALEQASFVLAICALVAPIMLQLYDFSLVQMYKLMKGGFSFKDAIFAFIGLLALLPKVVLRLFGIQLGDHADQLNAAEKAGTDVSKFSENTSWKRAGKRDYGAGPAEMKRGLGGRLDVGVIPLNASRPALRRNGRELKRSGGGRLDVGLFPSGDNESNPLPAWAVQLQHSQSRRQLVNASSSRPALQNQSHRRSAERKPTPRSEEWHKLENKLARARASKIGERSKVEQIPDGPPPNLGRSNSVRRTNGQTLARAVTEVAAGDDDARLVSMSRASSRPSGSLRQASSKTIIAQGSKGASPLVRSTTASLLFPSGCISASREDMRRSLSREERASVLAKDISRAELGI